MVKSLTKLLLYIVGRMNGRKYGAPEFYWWVKETLPEEDAEPILDAIDSGSEWNVKEAIFEHFNRYQLYPLALHYVAAVNWLDDDPEECNELEYSTFVTMHIPELGKDTEHEVSAKVLTDARQTLCRQVTAAYLQALRHGHKPWKGIFIELPRNQWCAEGVSIRCLKDDRERVKAAFLEQYEKNRNLPPKQQQAAMIPNVRLNIHVTINRGNMECKDLSFERNVNLTVTHQHITAHPREWYKDEDDID